MSPDHYIEVVVDGKRNMVLPAQQVRLNMSLHVIDQRGDFHGASVVGVSKIIRRGLFSPFTETHSLVVNGVSARCESAWFLEGWLTDAQNIVRVYHVLLAPLRFITSSVVTTEAMQHFQRLMGSQEASVVSWWTIFGYILEVFLSKKTSMFLSYI